MVKGIPIADVTIAMRDSHGDNDAIRAHAMIWQKAVASDQAYIAATLRTTIDTKSIAQAAGKSIKDYIGKILLATKRLIYIECPFENVTLIGSEDGKEVVGALTFRKGYGDMPLFVTYIEIIPKEPSEPNTTRHFFTALMSDIPHVYTHDIEVNM